MAEIKKTIVIDNTNAPEDEKSNLDKKNDFMEEVAQLAVTDVSHEIVASNTGPKEKVKTKEVKTEEVKTEEVLITPPPAKEEDPLKMNATEEVERDTQQDLDSVDEKKQSVKPVVKKPPAKRKSIIERKGKFYRAQLKSIDKSKNYEINEAISVIKKVIKKDKIETIDVVFRLNLNTKHADQQLRGTLALPNGTGKKVKILVLTKSKEKEAKEAGADYVGNADMIERIKNQKWFEFDNVVATPEMMPEIGKIGKLLGPKGLMPNPKLGTVTTDVVSIIKKIRQGMIEYRTDKDANVHCVLGKSSFTDKQLIENYDFILSKIIRSKPSSAKGDYVKTIAISSTMSPSVKIYYKS